MELEPDNPVETGSSSWDWLIQLILAFPFKTVLPLQTSFIWGQCDKNTTVIYCGNFNRTFSRVKMTFKNDLRLKKYYCHFRLIMLYNIGSTNTMVIYRHSTVTTKVLLLYNTEWQYDHEMAVKSFITLGTGWDHLFWLRPYCLVKLGLFVSGWNRFFLVETGFSSRNWFFRLGLVFPVLTGLS